MEPYRVFVSYAHEESDLAHQIVAILRQQGLTVFWDKTLSAGPVRFDEQIATFIAHAHVFLPIITPASAERGWVHQEIGYAMALRVPVLPICKGRTPDAMLQMLHAVELGDDPSTLAERLTYSVVDGAAKSADNLAPLFECAGQPDDRAKMMADYARTVRRLKEYGHVRQKGGLTSFSIPDKAVTNRAWDERYGHVHRSMEHRSLLLQEHKALKEHGNAKGYSLIIHPKAEYKALGPDVKRARLRSLIDFLEHVSDETIRVAFCYAASPPPSLTIVGDWFMAEAMRADATEGFRNTVFTRHGPTIRARMQEFDQEFNELLEEPENRPCHTRVGAIEALKDVMRQVN